MKRFKQNSRWLIRIPASTSNLGPGFDVLGLAVKLYLRVRVEASPSNADILHLTGVDSDILAQEKSNLILRVAHFAAKKQRFKLPALRLDISSEIPLAKGLGSSAAAIVAGVTLAELFSPASFTLEQFFNCAHEFESHPDNLAPCLLGGFTAASLSATHSAVVQSLPIDRRLKLVCAIPDFNVSTVKARRLLPQRLSRVDVVANLQNALLLSHVLGKITDQSRRKLFEDRIHQPFRTALVPGLREALSLPDQLGLVGIFLSGAGPTLAALATKNFSRIGRSLQNCFSKHGMSSRMLVLSIDHKGRSVRRLV
jgi:homoserine kinase